MEYLSLDSFKDKIFDFESNTEWSFKGTKPVIIDFYADWCGPCRQLSPIMEELAEQFKGKVDIYKVDTEQEQELSQLFAIRSIPAVLFIPLNDKPRMSIGAMSKDAYEKGIEELFGIN